MVNIRYVDRDIPLEIPQSNIIFDVQPHDTPAVADFRQTIVDALEHPVGTPRLAEMVAAGNKVTLVVDDNTRVTPTREIVPIVLDTLNAGGIPDADIQAVIASGTHRAMTVEEKSAKYGGKFTSVSYPAK